MASRASGYTYAVGKDGKKHRVYAGAKAPAKRAYAPKPYAYSGKGDYKLMKTPKPYRPSKSTTSTLGGSIGAYLGNGLHNVVKNLTGFGDYEVEENSLMAPKLGGDPPIVKNSNDNSHVYHHREYIADILASGAFSVRTFPINPGLIGTFPWLSQIADSYEQYRFTGMVFEYKSMSSDAVLSASASSSLGTVVMSTQYNVLDTPFTDKRTMENYEYANSCKPSCSMLHPIECKLSQTSVAELYIRTGNVAQGDLRLYDLGNFNIAVQGMQNTAPNQVIGELWVSFEIQMYKPKLLIGGDHLLSDHYAAANTGAITSSAYFGVANTFQARSGNNLGTTLQIAGIAPYAANAIVFPANVVDGLYQITYWLLGSGATTASVAYGTTINVDVISSAVTILGNNAVSLVQSPTSGTLASPSIMWTSIVRIVQTSPGTPAGFSYVITGTMPGGATQLADIIISQLQPTIN